LNIADIIRIYHCLFYKGGSANNAEAVVSTPWSSDEQRVC